MYRMGLPQAKAEASYIIYKDGLLYKRYNCSLGQDDDLGTDAATVINAALGNLTTGRLWKERVVLKGTFTIVSSINVPSWTILDLREARLVGSFSPALTGPMITNAGGTSGNSYLEIWGGDINVNTRLFNGIYFYGVFKSKIIGTTIHHAGTAKEGLYLIGSATVDHPSWEIWVENLYVFSCGGDGVRIDSHVTDCWWSDILLGVNGGYGMHIESTTAPTGTCASHMISSMHTWNNGLDGLYIGGWSGGVEVTNLYSESNYGSGVTINGAHYNMIEGRVWVNGWTAGNGVDIINSHHNKIMVSAYDTQGTMTQAWGINETGTSDYNDFTGSVLGPHLTGNLSYVGANDVVGNLVGYVTESAGFATMATLATLTTATHGLAATADFVWITPVQNTPAYFWATYNLAATFSILTSVANATTVLGFSWKAIT